MIDNLIFIRDKMPSFLAVTGDRGAGHGKFYPEIEFDGSVDNRVKAEDFLDAVGVFGVSPHADPGVHVMRQLGTSKEEGVGLGAVAQNDLRENAPFDDQIEVLSLQLFLNAKDLIEDAGIFRIGLFQNKGKDFHLGPGYFDIFRKPTRGAFHLDADLLMKGLLIGMVDPVMDPSSNIFNDADKLNTVAFPLKPGAAFVSGTCMKEGPVGGDDFIGEKPETFGDLYQDVKDLIVKLLPETFFKVGESGFTGNVSAVDPGVKTVMLPLIPVPQNLHEGFHVGVFFDVSEEIQQKKTDGIVCDSDQAILMGNNRTDKREIHEGRDKPAETSLDSSVVMDADVTALVNVFG